MAVGRDFLRLAVTKLKQRYVYGARAKFHRDFNGPWDCAEFVTWIVWMVTGKIFGVTKDGDPWTGAWKRDADRGVVKRIPVKEAYQIPGAILLRRGLRGGHIAFSDGNYGTIEAMNSRKGVTRGRAKFRGWTYGILIPDVVYERI